MSDSVTGHTTTTTENKKGVDLLLVNGWFDWLDSHILGVVGEEYVSKSVRGLVELVYQDAYMLDELYVELPDYTRVYGDQCYVELAFWFADFDNEFFDIGAFTQCDVLPDDYSWGELVELDKYHVGLMDSFCDQSPHVFRDWYREVSIKPKIIQRDCFNQMSHVHYYGGFEIVVSFMCDRVNHAYLDSWINSRFTWYNLARSLFNPPIGDNYFPETWSDK